MPNWGALVTSVLVVGVLALLLRWAYGGRSRSLVERRPRPGAAADYGLMVAITSPSTFVEGELGRQRLLDAGIRAQVVATTDGPRLMVLAEDEGAARRVLAGF